MTDKSSFQGRLFSERAFPSPATPSLSFSSKSRCLIDMGDVFIVVPEGDDLKPFQRSVFRLEGKRQSMAFADDSHLSKEDCKLLLLRKFDQLPHCEIVGANFPFFYPQEIEKGLIKYRPCVALYGESGETPLFIGVFVRAPKNIHDDRFGFLLSPPALTPSSAPLHLVGCTKLCSFPEVCNRPGTYYHRVSTWRHWLANPEGTESLSNIVRPAFAGALRKQIVGKLVDLLVSDPIVDYRDLTIALDIGTRVQGYKMHEDELCTFNVAYKGPPALDHDAMAKAALPSVATNVPTDPSSPGAIKTTINQP